MQKLKFIKDTFVKRYAIYGETKQVHTVDYFKGEFLEFVEIISEYTIKNKKFIKIRLPDDDEMQILTEACETISINSV